MNDKKLKALTDSVKKDINTAEHSILRKMDDVYRQTIYKTHVYLQSGATSLNQAIDMATKDFLDKGVNSIVYKDGKRVNIASYAEMALRTASQRATFLGEGKKRDEWGIHLVVVSAHANTCKLCLPWQGKILIDDVFSHGTKADGDYPLLSEAMAKGLLHPNCRHTLATYFPGITKLPKVPKEDVINANYKAEQRQRAIEREIRRWKRREAGSLDPKDEKMASDKAKELQAKLRQHLKDNPQLRRDYSREKPGPGINNKDVKVNKEPLKTNAENAKIKRDGAVRAKEFSKYWKEASLKDSINRFVPNHTVIKKLEKGKILYMSNDSNIQIVYDIKGNYFRIQDLSIKGKRSYLDLQGNNPTNKIVDGKQKGRSKEEYEPLTHFKNKDGDN
ncbi:phage minor capsid protein 2 [Clostridium pasteurianum DSM 525 = ATCC 6013]|uniref:Minor capsid 2 protein n=2 Tax=Clostridium pasteurianum TaxID=1501 RepID=A0A0H3J978_CLOPA|nr:phage minor capsid protein [Clostridium pasteurianum]AJA50069.1 phage minor capsid protein 2 [Clostridium pasteurianum DSM 525 = ATCC 6013]AJA54057.1 phage minor capsid protein 2 [Clostridium pasteurianum DSM 525 = ATCC 6013]KRU13918.1 minor capsid 2 protein [Clostridium pasteurianum DSM 525 = ATCC 6013]